MSWITKLIQYVQITQPKWTYYRDIKKFHENYKIRKHLINKFNCSVLNTYDILGKLRNRRYSYP